MACNRQSPFGDKFMNFVNKVPDYELEIKQIAISSELFKADLIVSIKLVNHLNQPEGNSWLISGDEENSLLFAKKIPVTMFDTDDHTIEFEYQVNRVKNGVLTFNLINEFVVGCDKLVTFTPNYKNIIK